jgi:hypothetical protein
MLLDKYMPRYDFTEESATQVNAPPEVVYRAVEEVTMAELSGIVRLLFFLRRLPEELVGRKDAPWDVHAPFMKEICNGLFTFLEAQSPREVVIGVIVPGDVGRVWKKSSALDIHPADAAEFISVDEPSHLKVVCHFLVEGDGEPGGVKIKAEWRTSALSPAARKRFTPYWRVIGPFSHLIQKLWVKAIKRRAERIAPPAV